MWRRAVATGWPQAIVRIVVGGVFIYMSLAKISHPIDFLKMTREYHMVPEDPGILLNSIAIVLPWVEILCGAALVLGLWIRGAAFTIALMLAIFTPVVFFRAMEINATVGTPFMEIQFDCGCGAGVEIIWQKMIKNSLLFIGSLVPLFARSRRMSLGSLMGRSAAPTVDNPQVTGAT